MSNVFKLVCIGLISHSLQGCGGSSSEPAGQTGSNGSESAGSEQPANTAPEPSGEDGLIGPVGGSGANGEYSQFNDSPFANLDFSGGYFYFEDFEDGIFEHPGASASHGDFVTVEFGDTFHDSVDADDGLIDGSSLDGESWFHDESSAGVTWTFNATELNGQLPTHVGIVWTDGRGEITFEAFDADGQLLGVINAEHDNESFNGETDEDRFYGVVNQSGVSAIRISNDNRLNGIEVDHLQWGFQG